eukprot:Skav213476  [mRNA]  locus=scaffold565:43554:53154:+ [translate_table: standard]
MRHRFVTAMDQSLAGKGTSVGAGKEAAGRVPRCGSATKQGDETRSFRGHKRGLSAFLHSEPNAVIRDEARDNAVLWRRLERNGLLVNHPMAWCDFGPDDIMYLSKS